MLLGALAEAFGLLMIVPIAAIAIGGNDPVLERWAPSIASLPPDQRFLAALGLFLAAMAARSALLYARDVTTAKLQSEYEASLRLRSAATLASRGWRFAGAIGASRLQSLLLVDVPRAATAVGYFQAVLVAAVTLAVQLAMTAILSPALTAIALLFLAAGGLVSTRWTRRGVHSGMAISESAEQSTGSGLRLHAGLKAALAQGTVGPFLDEYRASLDRASAHLVRFNREFHGARQLAAIGAAVAAAALLFVGVELLQLPFPVLIASLALFARMSAPAQQLQQSSHQLSASAPSFGIILRWLGALGPGTRTERPAAPLDWATLELDQVAFEHRPGLGLGGLSLRIDAGEWVGITGRSGAGKTTLADLVAGLIAPDSGSILVDGRPLAGERLERWRAGIAYLGQDIVVFNDSVRGNLLADGARATDEELWRALETAGLAKRVRALPGVLDASVGDRGGQLSGGERQRLAIARALLRRPTLLLLDEATAALDVDSESALIARLRALDPRPAALVVAHRASTLDHCDSRIAIQHEIIDLLAGRSDSGGEAA